MNSGGAALATLSGDFRDQAEFVANSAWRLLSLQDDNPLSPSYGCFHYAYWRDKTSEFPDARFQEAGAALGLLSMPFFDPARQDGRLPSSAELYRAFSAGLRNLASQQYPEGCFDEWYKGERGFAATEFTMIAYGLAARTMGDRVTNDDRALLTAIADKAGRWLTGRNDRVKANHEAAAAAALALIWELTGNGSFKVAARQKLDDTLARQRPEGWFPEIGGMDLGYCSVLLDYVMVYTLVTRDEAAIDAMGRLVDFMLPLIHPDCTISPEMGLCLNPYVSRLGIGLLSRYSASARALTAAMSSATVGPAGLRPYLSDDLRLARWSYLPLMTAILIGSPEETTNGPAPLDDAFPPGWTWHRTAAVCAYHDKTRHLYFSPAGGGTVRVYHGRRAALEDLGFQLETHDQRLSTGGYDPERPVSEKDNAIAVTCDFSPAKFLFPGFFSRLILRIGCTTAYGARILRYMVDYIRLKRRTASNQSAAPVAGQKTGYVLERTVEVNASDVRIHDRIRGPASGAPKAVIIPTLNIPGQEFKIPPLELTHQELHVVKILKFDAESPPSFSWRIEPLQEEDRS